MRRLVIKFQRQMFTGTTRERSKVQAEIEKTEKQKCRGKSKKSQGKQGSKTEIRYRKITAFRRPAAQAVPLRRMAGTTQVAALR